MIIQAEEDNHLFKNNLHMRNISVFLIAFIASSYMYSQEETTIGLYHSNGLLTDYEKYFDATNSIGVRLEHRFLKNWGIGGSINLHSYSFNNSNVNIKYSSIPIYLKYYTNILNISGLLFAESFISRSGTINYSDISPINNFGSFNYGVGISIGKQFNISEKITLEPEIKFISNSVDGLNSEFILGVCLFYSL